MDVKKFLNEHGVAPTALRVEIMRIIKNSHKPLSCEDLINKISANKTTIYRNLTLFEEKNILISSESNRKHYYELAKEAKAYFVCDKCHKMQEISMPVLNQKHVKSVVIKGICDECYE